MKSEDIKDIINKGYSKMFENGYCGSKQACGSRKKNEDISRSIGYSEEELNNFSKSNLGFGRGNPVAMSSIGKGDVVLDLKSGAGFDVEILGEDREISKEQYKGICLESLKLKLIKRTRTEEVRRRCCCNG